MNKFYCIVFLLSAVVLCFFTACEKALEVDNPIDQVVAKYVYQTDYGAQSVITGIYAKLSSDKGLVTGDYSISVLSGLAGDELDLLPGDNQTYNLLYLGGLTSSNAPFWSGLYDYIYRVNAAMEGITSSNSLTSSVKSQLLGEAKFIRAFCYFYLVNFFSDVPIVTTTDYRANAGVSRKAVDEVYQQIIEDLLEAQTLLSENYVENDAKSISDERIRPNKSVATALLARIYLYKRNWKAAIIESSKIINNAAMFDTVPLNEVFLKNSKETIWQLQPVNPTVFNTEDARFFILENGPNQYLHPVYLSHDLINSFEENDKRKQIWVNYYTSDSILYYYPFKYRQYKLDAPSLEYLMVFRLAEQYLIRAEAFAQEDDFLRALKDLNKIRLRAGLSEISSSVRDELLELIFHERKVELFSEWGHRWLDLKRTKKIDSVMQLARAKRDGIWNTNWQNFPIPESDIRLNQKLTQNAGY